MCGFSDPTLPVVRLQPRRNLSGRSRRLTLDNWPAGLFCNFAARLSADHFEVRLKDISSGRRCSLQVAHARQVAMYLAHVVFSISLASVAVCFGRDRSTVAYACHRIEDRRDDPAFDAILLKMELAAAVMRGFHMGEVRL